MSRRLSYIGCLLGTVLMLFLAVACFEINPVVEPSRADDVPMIVDITFPNDRPQTKSMVPGTENDITVMQLLCFDASGLYLGIRTVDPTPNDYGEKVTTSGVQSDMTQSGRIIARLPGGTARVHFIANRNLPAPLEFTAGTAERIVLNSLTTLYNDANHQEIIYWGYHIEKTAKEMLTWMQVAVVEDPNTHEISLKDGAVPNKVYLIRDRARLQLTFDSGLVGSGCPYSKVEWLIHNGRSAGLVAPYNLSQSEDLTATPIVNPWTAYTDASGTYATVPLTECTAEGRYTLWTSAADENRTFDSSDSYQYLFDDSNQMSGNVDNRIKIILKVYPTSGAVKYLVILLKKDNDLLEVVRNNTYVMNIRSLDARGYATLQEAINGTEFANAPVESPRGLTSVADENYILQISLDQTPETADNNTATVVYGSTGVKVLPFKFLNLADNSPVTGLSASDFEVWWEENTNASWTPSNSTLSTNLADYLSYNSTTNCWEVRVNLTQIGTSQTGPYRDYIIIRHKNSGITRYIHIYGIQSFALGQEPQFTKENVTYSETVNNVTKTYDVYKLTFKLPDTYGEDLYPINIRMATTTLEPYSDDTSSARNGTFGVVIQSTSVCTPTSTTTTDWNYKSISWGYWYEYSLPSMPDQGGANQGLVTFYLLDTRDSKSPRPTSVGLFLDIPYFGGLRYYHIP
jgi:hypothetical protein